MSLQIGVVGYSESSFDKQEAKQKLITGLNKVINNHSGEPVLVSGLTALGVPKLAYEEAEARNWKTVGIACSKASDFECYPVDEKQIVGNEWGDESEVFLDRIDVLLRVGGGEQTKNEVKMAKSKGITVYEYDVN